MSDPLLELSRVELERVIDALISMLDEIDPDPDLEPSLGSTHTEYTMPPARFNQEAAWGLGSGARDDREGTDHLGKTDDDEPSLSWSNEGSQVSLGSGSQDDREEEHDGREPDEDGEPTMGWQNTGSNSCLWGQTRDGENEPELGWSDMEARYGRYGVESDRGLEQEHDGREPSLGWQNEGSQARLHTSRNDCEEQCEDEGAQHDDREPDYQRPPKGYMHSEDLLCLNSPSLGVKGGQS